MVNSTLYRNQTSGKSLNFFAFLTGMRLISALSLLVLLFTADHEQHTLAPDDLAVAANFLY
jgi:hypothetical protein